MEYLRERDPLHTALMIQVENELGLMGAERDHSRAALEAWSKPVPQELQTLMNMSGCWSDHPELGEVFMAWHYAKAVEEIASAGKAILPLPMYANAWLVYSS